MFLAQPPKNRDGFFFTQTQSVGQWWFPPNQKAIPFLASTGQFDNQTMANCFGLINVISYLHLHVALLCPLLDTIFAKLGQEVESTPT